MTILRSPIRWWGGKGRVVHRLLQYVPPHRHYVEVFGGGAALLFAKPPCEGVETYNDLDGGLVNLFRVLRDPEKFARFHRLASLTLYSREEFYWYKNFESDSDVERAHAFFVVARMSIAGDRQDWSRSIKSHRSSIGAFSYSSTIERLPQLHRRLRNVQIERRDFRKLIPEFVTPRTLIYCDPPYVPSTRMSPNKYSCEMSNDDHGDLLDILVSYSQMAVLSGYDNDMYDNALRGWHRVVLSATDYKITYNASRPKPNEILWLNPLAWDTLYQSKQLNLF